MTAHVVLHASAYDRFPSGARTRAVGIAAALLRAGCRVTVQTPVDLFFRALVEAEFGGPLPPGNFYEVETRLDPTHPIARMRDAAAEAERTMPPDADLFLTDYYPVVESVPTVLTAHDLRYVTNLRDESTWRAAAFRSQFAAIAARAALVAVPTQAVASEVRKYLRDIHPSRIVVSPNAPGLAWRSAPPIEGPGAHLVVVGIGDRRKRFDMLVNAIRAARARGPVLPVIAAWRRGPEAAQVEARTSDLSGCGALRFAWAPSDADLVAIVAGSAALLHPSRYEGFGLPVIEAFSCGVPVVATRIPAVEEVAGLFATWAPDNEGAWADALLDVSADPARRVHGRDGRRRRAAEFTWDRAAVAILDGFARVRS
ncbi:MAG: glycosyltransferase [Planctomycetes bacterium]|nr:glycosyltransferase [Planctomycetota bacterium]